MSDHAAEAGHSAAEIDKHVKVYIIVFVALTVSAEAAQFQPSNNGQIAFTRADGGDDDIFVMGNDGSNPTNLTNLTRSD